MTESITQNPIIIVPFQTWHDWVIECLEHCLLMTTQSYTVWLLPDELPNADWRARLDALQMDDRLHIEPTGPGNPARKRNIGMTRSKGSIFGLIDSDAYPHPDWLSEGLKNLTGDIAIVAGPNLTPPNDPLARRVCGNVMQSPLGFGSAYIRHVPSKRQMVNEMPTCNMIIKRIDNLLFHEELDTAEDMAYCAELRGLGYSILYTPEVIVYHHRRKIIQPFVHQFYHYGLDKGRLVRQPNNITYPWHAAPAIFSLYLAVACFLWATPSPHSIIYAYYAFGAFSLLVFGAESLRQSRRIEESVPTLLAFFLGHISYGTGYILGAIRPTSTRTHN